MRGRNRTVGTFVALLGLLVVCAPGAVRAEEKTPEEGAESKTAEGEDEYVTPPKEYLGLLEANVGDFDEEYKIVNDYHATYTRLSAKKAEALNDREREILKAYKDAENISFIQNATQELLGDLRGDPQLRPKTRAEEMRQLAAIEKTWTELAAAKDAEPAKGQSKLRKPSKQEEEEIAAFLQKVIALLSEKKYKEIAANYTWYTPGSSPLVVEKRVNGMGKYYTDFPKQNPLPLFKALLEGRQNWFMFGEYRAILIREKRFEKELEPALICVGLDFDQEKAKWVFRLEHNPMNRFYKGAYPEIK